MSIRGWCVEAGRMLVKWWGQFSCMSNRCDSRHSPSKVFAGEIDRVLTQKGNKFELHGEWSASPSNVILSHIFGRKVMFYSQ